MGALTPETVSRWFQDHAPALVLYARQWLADGQAEDAVQEAFVGLIRCGRPPDDARAWLFRAVRNAATSRLRSDRRRQRRERHLAADRSAWFSPDAEGPIDAAAAQSAVRGLTPQQREVVVMRIWGDLTLQQIADVVGSPVSTVFSRYRAALTALRERMGEPCDTKTD